MKEIPLSLCERSSVISNLEAEIRLDGRSIFDIRTFSIQFGKDFGCCTVSVGETRVLGQVTCEIVEPAPSRPNEGRVLIAVHLSPMAAPYFEQGRGIDVIDDIHQILERNIKESRCLDLESLCIVAEESVWLLKIDVTILNHAGNLRDASNLAAVSAVRHFHRPDVTVEEDGRVTIHTEQERPLIPTFLKKIPVCLTYGLFIVDNKTIVVADPTEKEERVMSGKLSVGLNPHGEITSLLFPGKVCLKKGELIKIVGRAFVQAKTIAEKVTKLVEEDLGNRKPSLSSEPVGYVNTLKSDQEYVKDTLVNRINRFKVSESVKKERSAMDTSCNESAGGGNTDEVNEEEMSDEEFSEELLSKSLIEIRASKQKQEKFKRLKSEGETENTEGFLDHEVEASCSKLTLELT